MKILKKLAIGSLFLASLGTANAYKVALLMPDQTSRWHSEGFLVQKILKENNFEVELFYAGDTDVKLQNRQVVRVSNSNADAIVIVPVDGSALNESLSVSNSNNVPVICYDRLVTGTDYIDYYVTFDNEEAGRLQGQFVIDKLGLYSPYDISSPKKLEILSGSVDDNNSGFFYKGAMKVLQPYLDTGAIVIPSGKTSLQDTSIKGWLESEALKRTESLLQSQGYNKTSNRLDAILSAADCLTDGAYSALKKAGYSDKEMPIMTGQDATRAAIKRFRLGMDQTQTISKPAKLLAESIVKILNALKNGDNVPYNDDHTYNNGKKIVKSLLSKPVQVTSENFKDFTR